VWSDDHLHAELLRYVSGREHFPTKREFLRDGEERLWVAMRNHGGYAYWAHEVGLPLKPPRRALTDEEAVAQARELIAREGRLPNTTRLAELGYRKLRVAVQRAGGSARFCELHGLAR